MAIKTFSQSVELYVVAEAESRKGARRIANEALFTAACGEAVELRTLYTTPGSALETFQAAAPHRRQERLLMRNMLTRLYAD